MGSGKTRRRRAGWVESAGLALLSTVWSGCFAVLAAVAGVLGSGARWFLRQGLALQVIAVALLVGGGFVAASALRSGEVIPVVDDVEALARVIRSEAGTGSAQQRVHVAWATRNLAAARRQSIARMACAPCGPQQAGRPVSSRQAATDADRELARHVLAEPPILDATGGATHFVNPELQDELASGDRAGYRGRPYSFIRRQWSQAYGLEPYYRLGPDLELWGPRR